MPQVDLTIVSWRAWFWDVDRKKILRFDSGGTRWEDLPAHGALMFCLYQRERPRRRMMCGVSLYWHDPSTDVYACDDHNDALIPDELDKKFIKYGKWVNDTTMGIVEQEAIDAKIAVDESVRVDKPRG
jgi:hypothetical protein